MGDYGFRISIAGQDVKTCNDLDTILNSKYANLKGTISGSGSYNHPGDSSTVTITIPHGLGYIPFGQVYTKESDNGTRITPYYFIEGLSPPSIWKYWSAADATNFYIYLNLTKASALTISYYYWIFTDKGKL